MKLAADAAPRLARGVRLSWDQARERWALLAPERVFVPDEIALAVLRRCDGATSIAEMSRALAAEYSAPPEEVEADVLELLDELSDKGVVTA